MKRKRIYEDFPGDRKKGKLHYCKSCEQWVPPPYIHTCYNAKEARRLRRKPILTLMSGLPRSGKSTWVSKNKKRNDIVICPDDIRQDMFGHNFHSPAEPIIWAVTAEIMKMLMKQRFNIILDACNLDLTGNDFIDIAKESNYKLRLVIMNTPYEECKKRNQIDTKLSVDVLERMKWRVENRKLDDLKNMKIYDKITVVNF